MNGIYCYINKTSGLIDYVGLDSNINRKSRYYAHRSPAEYNKQPFNRILQNNLENYDYKVITKGKFTLNRLRELEKKFIKKYNPRFNFTHGGDGATGCTPWNKGKKWSEEVKKKISSAHKGKKIDDTTRKALIKANTLSHVPSGEELYHEYFNSNMTYRELGEKYNCGRSTIDYRISKFIKTMEE